MIRLDLVPDWRVLAFTAAVSIGTGILFGLAPAMRGASLDLAPALKQGGRAVSTPQRFARALSVAQVGLSLVLLAGAGLLVRTPRNVDNVDGGFPRDRVYTVELSPRGSDQNQHEHERAALQAAAAKDCAKLDRLNHIGVRFMTLRRRSPKMMAEIAAEPISAWRRMRSKEFSDVPYPAHAGPKNHPGGLPRSDPATDHRRPRPRAPHAAVD